MHLHVGQHLSQLIVPAMAVPRQRLQNVGFHVFLRPRPQVLKAVVIHQRRHAVKVRNLSPDGPCEPLRRHVAAPVLMIFAADDGGGQHLPRFFPAVGQQTVLYEPNFRRPLANHANPLHKPPPTD